MRMLESVVGSHVEVCVFPDTSDFFFYFLFIHGVFDSTVGTYGFSFLCRFFGGGFFKFFPHLRLG